MHIAALTAITQDLLPEVNHLHCALTTKAREFDLLESISFSAAVMQVFTDKCIKGMQATKERYAELVDPQFGARNSSRPGNRDPAASV